MKRKLFHIGSIIALLISSTLFSQTKTILYQQLPDYNGSATGSGMYFGATMNSSIITITFEGPANKWIAFGFGTSMQPTDVFIYSQGQSSASHPLGWYDYYNSSYNGSGVTLDATQNWSVVSTGTVSGGQRTVTASRVLNTGDPNDVAVSFTAASLDLVWARGASANYTIAYHGSTNRANGISLPWLSSPTASFSSSSQTICQGSSVTFSNLTTGGQTSYAWNFPGGSPASSTSTNPVISYTSSGVYSVALTASNAIGTNTYTQINYITVTPTVVPSVSVNLTAGANPQCAGSPVTFSANVTNGGAAPGFQWKVNGVNVGSNSPTFTSNTLSNSNTVTCVLLSNQSCANPSTAISSGITMTVNSSAPSSLSIVQQLGSNPLCVGSAVGFSATPFNGGSNPSYQWKVNGINAGNNSPTFTSSTLSNGDIVTCVLNSNDPCTSSSVAISSGITMTVSTLLSPVITVSLTNPSPALCSGAVVSFTSNSLNGGATPSYQWFVNGLSVGTNSPGFSSSSLNNNDVLTCTLLSALTCASPSSVASTPITLSIQTTPATPSIAAAGPSTICPGDPLVLSSSSVNNNVWSTNATSASITVSAAGIYSLLTVVNSCSSAPASISVFEYPVISPSISAIGLLCLQSDPVVLSGQPAGGFFSGAAVQSGIFQPTLATLGSGNLIIYTSSQQFGSVSCSDTSVIMVTVNDCTGLSSTSRESSVVRVFPNPSNSFTLQHRANQIKSLHVYDLGGNEVQVLFGGDDEAQELKLQNCPAGLYFLKVETGSETLFFRLVHKP